jgi:hypothetical protein
MLHFVPHQESSPPVVHILHPETMMVTITILLLSKCEVKYGRNVGSETVISASVISVDWHRRKCHLRGLSLSHSERAIWKRISKLYE